ncbi:MAG: aspartate aminotransferase family protein [Gammaproteobacteria bacterium]
MTDEHIMHTYARQPVTFTHGEGTRLWDDQGKEYLDALCGIAVTSLGHAHPAITRALCEQAGQLLHTSNIYGIANQARLADELCRLAGMDRAFFSNSGAEANEAAIKLVRKYGHGRGIELPTIIVTEGSFHGRTLATLSATGNSKIQVGFEPLVQGFVRVPYNDIEAIVRAGKANPSITAVMVEPITGEGGIRLPDSQYLNQLRQLCDQHDWLLVLDEIQTGMCRTGRWFAHQHNDIQPDVMTLAKALGNGVPIGACLARGKAAEVFTPGNHGSTYGGNPLACRAALAVIEVMETNQLAKRAAELGDRIAGGLQGKLAGIAGVNEIRHKGLMIGIELERPCAELVKQGLDKGILINVTAERVVRLLPPLILDNAEADQIVTMVSQLIMDFLQG